MLLLKYVAAHCGGANTWRENEEIAIFVDGDSIVGRRMRQRQHVNNNNDNRCFKQRL